MAPFADSLDLGRLQLSAGEGRRLDLEVDIDPFDYGGQRYAVEPARVPVRLDISRTTGSGFALRLRFEATLDGPCMRCLGEARPTIEVDAREVDQPGVGDEELISPYVDGPGARPARLGPRRARARPAGPGHLPRGLPRPVPGLRRGSQ